MILIDVFCLKRYKKKIEVVSWDKKLLSSIWLTITSKTVTKLTYNLHLATLTSTQRPKTYNEKKLEDEQKILEENQKKIAMEYETSKEVLKKNYKSCPLHPEISQDRQQECYKGESVSEWIFLFHIIICLWLKNHLNTPSCQAVKGNWGGHSSVF